MGLISEFREFAIKGNMVDMAVGIVIGGAFGTIVSTLVNKIVMPPIGMLTAGIDFGSLKLVLKDGVEAVKEGDRVVTPAVPEVAIGYGEFINALLSFLIVAICLFIVVKMINTARAKFEKEQEEAPPPGPTKDQELLMEIRDAIKANG